MDGVDRILGELQENKRATSKRLDRIENKVDSLVGFKWNVVGFAAAISCVLTVLIEILRT